MIYLDAGATTLQKPPMVAYHMQSALRRMATPGRGAYAPAMRAADAVYDCRVLAAELFGAQPEQVVFTMNATHALNLAIKTLVRPGGRAVISGFEHNAVVRPLHHIGAEMIVADAGCLTRRIPSPPLKPPSRPIRRPSSVRMCRMSSAISYRWRKSRRSAARGGCR